MIWAPGREKLSAKVGRLSPRQWTQKISSSGSASTLRDIARGAVDVDRHVDAGIGLEGVQRSTDLRDRFIGTVEGRTKNCDDANRVLVAALNRFLSGEMKAIPVHGDETHLDVPVVGKLFPADLDIYSHNYVGLVCCFTRRRASLLPAALERKPTEHGRLAGARRRTARCLGGVRHVPQTAQDADTTYLKLCRIRVLVLVNHVLVVALGHKPLRLRLHPSAHKGRQVQAGVSVEH